MESIFEYRQYNDNRIQNRINKIKRGYVRERILRVLLNNADKELTKYKIGKLSQANISWVIETLRKLEEENMVKGTKVKDFRKLTILWQKSQLKPLFEREYMLRNPHDLLTNTSLQYALTTYHAENLVQSYLFPSRTDFYINLNDIRKWHDLLTKNGLVGKGNVRVLGGDKHVFYGSFEISGLKLVSIPQLIVDLLNEGGVCVEAADKLLERVTGYVIPEL